LVFVVAFSSDGRTALTGSWDKTARLWDVGTGKPLGPALAHEGSLYVGAFSPDGKTLVTGSDDHTARLWEVPTPLRDPVQRLVLWTQVATGMELDANGVVQVLDAQTWIQKRRRLEELGGPPEIPQRPHSAETRAPED
jgi:WD40 repeat protein